MGHPTQLGKYAIEGVLGSGAMGVVYEATDPGIQRRVALKTIRRALMDGQESGALIAARFRNEAQAAGRLSHPGIVAIYDYGEEGDTAFIAMELVQGQDLGKILSVNPVMSEAMLLQVMDQLLAALDYAHEQGVWHRDIKPANILLTRSGQLKVTDFGIARIRDAALTQITSTIGTHGYMSPEQYRGQPIDHRVDIFAAGVLLYRLLAGQPAFAGETTEAIMYKVLHEEPPAPSAVNRIKRGIEVDAVVRKALAKQARERYPSAAAFREALRLHAGKTSQGNPVIGAALNWDDTVVDEQAAQWLRQAAPKAGGAGQWDDQALSVVERALASFVGPMARVLVKKAAAGADDLDTLMDALALHLPSAQERERFMAKLRPGRTGGASGTGGSLPAGAGRGSLAGTGSGGSLPAAAAPASGSSSGANPAPRDLTPGFVAHALKVLTAQMGPMARLVVKKAEVQAHGADEFIELLIRHSADGIDKDALFKALQRGFDLPTSPR